MLRYNSKSLESAEVYKYICHYGLLREVVEKHGHKIFDNNDFINDMYDFAEKNSYYTYLIGESIDNMDVVLSNGSCETKISLNDLTEPAGSPSSKEKNEGFGIWVNCGKNFEEMFPRYEYEEKTYKIDDIVIGTGEECISDYYHEEESVQICITPLEICKILKKHSALYEKEKIKDGIRKVLAKYEEPKSE